MKAVPSLAAILIALTVAAAVTGCVVEEAPVEELFPAQVGELLRTQGPAPDPATEVDQATYQAPSGMLLLRIKRVGAEQIETALSELPPTATNIGYDPILGQRNGVFFTFAEEFHAAWGNGDWVFVLSATAEAARAAFLSAYGY